MPLLHKPLLLYMNPPTAKVQIAAKPMLIFDFQLDVLDGWHGLLD
jgi:hypothetical protein